MSTSNKGRGLAVVKASAGGSEALQRLKRGEITLDEFLDAKVEQALAHVDKYVSAEQREVLREIAREQLKTDPVLGEYVRQATGRVPGSSSKD